MADPTGVADRGALRLDIDRRLMIQFRGSAVTSDGGLLAYRELEDSLALTASGGERLAEARTTTSGYFDVGRDNRASFRDVLDQQRYSLRAGRMVRIRFAPAASLQTFGSRGRGHDVVSRSERLAEEFNKSATPAEFMRAQSRPPALGRDRARLRRELKKGSVTTAGSVRPLPTSAQMYGAANRTCAT